MANQLAWGFRQLTCDYREGSFQTQNQQKLMLELVARELRQLGFQHLTVKNLKQRHVQRLVAEWQTNNSNCGTIKNRLSAIRWAMRKSGRPGALPRCNSHMGIENRKYVPTDSKAKFLDKHALKLIRYPEIKVSLLLESAFGLRREESLKFRPMVADKGTYIWLQGSWCKGGRPRAGPIRTDFQRSVLQTAHRIAGRGSLIPPDRTFKQHLNRFTHETRRVGLNGVHCLRHAYAQVRFRELTGLRCPLSGGPDRKTMSIEQRELDREARLIISEELGHGRPSVTIQYLGR